MTRKQGWDAYPSTYRAAEMKIVHIANIRKKIEQNPAEPRYLITWHGRPGGYQFFPEGRPE